MAMCLGMKVSVPTMPSRMSHMARSRISTPNYQSKHSLKYQSLLTSNQVCKYLILPGVKIPLHPEVHSRPPLCVLLHLVAVQLPNLAARVEDADETGIVHVWPLLHGELQRVLRELDGNLAECQVPVQTQPGVVEAESHEGEEEVELLVDLRLRVPDGQLEVAVAVVAALVVERVPETLMYNVT